MKLEAQDHQLNNEGDKPKTAAEGRQTRRIMRCVTVNTRPHRRNWNRSMDSDDGRRAPGDAAGGDPGASLSVFGRAFRGWLAIRTRV